MKKTEKIFLKDLYYECESSGDPMTTRLIIYPNGDLEAQHFYDGDGPEHAEISHSNGGFNQRETDLFLAEGVNPDESQAARRAFFQLQDDEISLGQYDVLRQIAEATDLEDLCNGLCLAFELDEKNGDSSRDCATERAKAFIPKCFLPEDGPDDHWGMDGERRILAGDGSAGGGKPFFIEEAAC